MSRRMRETPNSGSIEPCPACGSRNRAGDSACWDCLWDDYPEAHEKPEEEIRPNYVSLRAARFIAKTYGAHQLKAVNQAGPKAAELLAVYQAKMKALDADNA
jgi:hypothetical protein